MSNVAQAKFWLGTIFSPHPAFPISECPPGVSYIKGQTETCPTTGREHYQLVVCLSSRGTLATVKRLFGGNAGHWERSRSTAANAYVWKEETSVDGTRFEFGTISVNPSKAEDWEAIWSLAKSGDIEKIPARIRVVSYRTIRAIGSDYSAPVAMVRAVRVFWGTTGSGKSFSAWSEAGEDAYAKCPRTKFWDGYQSQRSVVMDEFRGGIDVSHLLRWFDRYPVRVEIKGSTVPFLASDIWITSNIAPEAWYPDIDSATLEALMRRIEVKEFSEPYVSS